MARGKPDAFDIRDKRERADMAHLANQPEFKRFLWRVIQSARIFDRNTDGSHGRNLDYFEGARNLGLAILDMVEQGQPASHQRNAPILTLIQTLLEEANPPPSERDDEERDDYDRTAELDDEDDPS